MANNAANVSVGKPKIGGAVYNAPAGSELPTDALTPLSDAYTCLGYVSDDGVTNSNGGNSENVLAWGGDIALSFQADKEDTWKFALIESLNVDVLKAVYGSDNVTGSFSEGLVVRANNEPLEASIWVIETMLTGNISKRVVIPNAVLTGLEDITYKDNEAIKYGVTLTAYSGGEAFDYDTHKEYFGESEASDTYEENVVTGATGATGET